MAKMNTVCPKCNHLMIDNTHECPSPEYERAKQKLMQDALDAEDEFSLDELEDYLRSQQNDDE